MLSFLRVRRAEHPLADIKRATQRLQRLPTDPVRALQELCGWLSSVHGAVDLRPEQRAAMIKFLDTSAQRYLGRASRAFAAAKTLPGHPAEQDRIWTALCDFYKQDALALGSCIDAFELRTAETAALRPMRAGLSIRALRAMRELLKWLSIRYGPLDEPVWQMASAVYALADRSKYSTTPYTLYAKSAIETTVEREYLRIAMFSASSPQSLTPLEIEIAERIIASRSDDFVITPLYQSGVTFWVDLATERAPQRYLTPPPPQATMRFLSAAQAAEKVLSLAGAIMLNRMLPAQFADLEGCTSERLLSVLTHLAGHWSAQPAQRRHPRHAIAERLSVVHGFSAIINLIANTPLTDSPTKDASSNEIESWAIENVSAGGIGARVERLDHDGLGVGGVLALQIPSAQGWQIGLVRRLSRTAQAQASVGIEVLARDPLVAPLRVELEGELIEPAEPALLMDAPALSNEEGGVRVLVRSGLYVPGQSFNVDYRDERYTLHPRQVLHRGDDHVLIRCEATRASPPDASDEHLGEPD